MTPILHSPPAIEPVSLAEAKAWLRIEGNDEDSLVAALVTTARMLVEQMARRCLIDQTWRIVADRWPVDGRLVLPRAPVRAIAGVRALDSAGLATTVPETAYRLDAGREPAELRLTGPLPLPGRFSGGIEIDIVCGFGPDPQDVPEPLRHAIRLLVARWYENRGDATADAAALPPDIAALVASTRRPRLA